MTTGFKDKDGKFRPTEKMKVSPQLEKFRRELDIKQLPDSEISKGLEKAEEFSLTPEFVTRLKKEKQKRLQTEIDEKKEIESAKKEIIPSAIFFNEGDIESVDYEFTKDGRIFYPRGFEKEILLEFNAKKLNEKEIEDLFKKVKSEKLPQTDATNTDEFLQENLTENTQFTDTILDHDFEFGSVTTDEDTDDERQYFIIRERDTNIYDVTDLKGESVGGTGEPFGQIREFIFPQASFLFKFQGQDFEFDYVNGIVGIGFGQGSNKQVDELQKNKVSRINIVLDDFLAKKGKEAKRFFGNVAGR